jgi:hypothetical protein
VQRLQYRKYQDCTGNSGKFGKLSLRSAATFLLIPTFSHVICKALAGCQTGRHLNSKEEGIRASSVRISRQGPRHQPTSTVLINTLPYLTTYLFSDVIRPTLSSSQFASIIIPNRPFSSKNFDFWVGFFLSRLLIGQPLLLQPLTAVDHVALGSGTARAHRIDRGNQRACGG